MTSYLWILVLVYLAGATAQDLNLGDALDDTTTPPKPDVKQPKQGSDDFNLNDAIDSDTPNEPNKPPPAPPKPADPKKPLGGDGFSNDDLLDVVGDEYKPDPGRGHGGRASDPGYDTKGDDTDQSQGAQGSQVAGILSGLGVLIVGAASSYFAYYKKKLCFKIQGGADPESGGNQSGVHSEPQTLTNLLRTS